MNNNPFVDQIDFDAPDERLVTRAIFHGVGTNAYRGFSDVFSEEQILRMGSSDHVYECWSEHNRSWLISAIDAALMLQGY